MDLELVRHLIEDVIDEWYCYGEIGLVEVSLLEMAVVELELWKDSFFTTSYIFYKMHDIIIKN